MYYSIFQQLFKFIPDIVSTIVKGFRQSLLQELFRVEQFLTYLYVQRLPAGDRQRMI